jgi:probable rRNA maturation factor
MATSITATARSYPHLPYDEMKTAILGKDYELSLAFVGETRARAINIANRKKTYAPNVLSFPLDARAGEIIIVPVVAARQATQYNMTTRGYIGYLFIHGLLHLTGLDHGPTMDAREAAYVKQFKLR